MTKLGRYRYWGDRKPDISQPLLTFTRTQDRVVLKVPGDAAADGSDGNPTPVGTATLRIYGPIDDWGGWWGVSANEVASALDQLGDAEQVIVRVNSPGGSTFEGRAIMNLLRAHPARCIGVVDGLAASAASYIVVGCDETVMAPGTELMIHDTHTIIYGDAAALRKEADVVDSISRSGSELYADVAGGTAAQWRELQRAETWFTADEAVAAGLADRVGIVADSGPVETAGDDGPVETDLGEDSDARDRFDLSIFNHPGRAHAPAPNPPTASAGGSVTTQEGRPAVAFTDEQITEMRTKLGIAGDADEATIVAALTEALTERAEPESSNVPPGHVVVPEARLKDLEEGAAAGVQAAKALREREREEFLDANRTKFAPANRDSWAKEFDRDPEGTRKHFEAAAEIVPLDEIGHGVDVEESEPSLEDVRADANYQNWRM